MIKKLLAAMAIIITAALAAPANAQVHVNVEEGHLNPMPIAIVDFMGGSPAAQQVGRDVAGVIRANLERSALFRAIPSDASLSASKRWKCRRVLPTGRSSTRKALLSVK